MTSPRLDGGDPVEVAGTTPRSIFQFTPATGLQAKKTSRTNTPRNLVFPEANEFSNLQEDASLDVTIAVTSGSKQVGASARKYQLEDDGGETQGAGRQDELLTTGLPSANPAVARTSPTPSARRSMYSLRRAQSLRAIRGSFRFLRQESVVLTKRVLHSSRHIYRQLSLQQLLAYLLILFGLLSESATPAPRYNVPVGIVLFMTAISDLDHRIVVSGLCLTSLVDILWLLRPQEGSFNGFFRVQIQNITQLSLAVCVMIKIWLVFSTYFDLGPEFDSEPPASATKAHSTGTPTSSERPVSSTTPVCDPTSRAGRLWSHLKYFFPRKTLPRRSHLSFEVLMRVLALVWIHGICGIGLMFLGLTALMEYSGRAQFRSAKLGIPLHLVMLFKAATTLLTYVIATHHMSYHGCFKLFGCDLLARWHEDSASEIVLKYNAKWLNRLKRAKLVDALMGVYLMLVYYSAFHSATFLAGEGVTAILVLAAVIILVLDFWTPLLIMVVARCGAVLHTHHRSGSLDVDPYFPNQLEWEDNEESASKRTGQSNSDSDSSDDDSSSSSSSSSSDSSSDADTDASRRSRRRRARERRRRRQSKRALKREASSRRALVPPLKRANSMLVIDADDPDAMSSPPSQKPYWVRHWDKGSNRSYLVHSVTQETVWEVRPTTTRRTRPSIVAPVVSSREDESPLMRSSRPPASHPPLAATGTPRSARNIPLDTRRTGSARVPSEMEMAMNRTPLPSARRLATPRREEILATSPRLASEDFMLLWDALPDGGGFTCRVSKIPQPTDLRLHLDQQGFHIVYDGLNIANVRTARFYAILAPPGSLSAPISYFLAEFLLDSLSLKLYATFRCAELDAIVPCVKRLQLKELVGAYTPCE
ncbi:hypothetical protein Poli38472_003663 [Pythium oligandrum]|uniref:WW domain-containing protein n=1 Tax=Pythium oligandrum TaxID=41045 RepID=A0A8K1CN15_PYTOL|nr:hypothetical protein Poli38472_003663 [Pythium oligandrum]|eukprot:TMW65898.1 hypothetical protein Poli38472_003663 [Pythium oligandrum]